MASMRLPLFQAFPRTGPPRAFADYRDWVGCVEALVGPGAIPAATHIWWDLRLQPRFGTVEVRVMDAQTEVADAAALAALVHCLAAGIRAGEPVTRPTTSSPRSSRRTASWPPATACAHA
jgi:carboxylate-amine ligase